MKSENDITTIRIGKGIFLTGILVIIFLSVPRIVYPKETGFVALSEGFANYEHISDEQRATSSFFLVDLFEEYNVAMGAIILNSHQSIADNRTYNIDSDTDLYEIQLENIRHSAWGTLLAYSLSSESLLGMQGWLGFGFLSNTLEFDGTTVSLYRHSDNSTQLCELTLEGRSVEVKSFPIFVGIGITFWGFGFFVQYMQQQTEPMKVSVSVTDKCTLVYGSDQFSDTYNEKFSTEIKSSFTLISSGIQYRF